MLSLKTKFALLVLLICFFSVPNYSQMTMGAGTLIATIDGKIDTISLNISQHSEPNSVYCDAMGGTAEIGMFHFIFEKAGNYSDVKPQTFDLSTSDGYGHIQWADFLTVTPYVYKSGKFVVTSNDGKTLHATYEAVAELGGSSIMGNLFKGKSETTLTNGIVEINYAK